MTQDGLHDLGLHLGLVHQPVAKAVPQVMKAEAMSVRNLYARLQGCGPGDDLQQRLREIAARGLLPSATEK